MPLRPPLSPHSEVVDKNRRWTPDWYSWLFETVNGIDDDFLTLENFGAKGDGIKNDTGPVNLAFTTAAAQGLRLVGGGPGKIYKIVGRGPQLTDKVLDFSGRGCTFKCYDLPATSVVGASAVFGFYDSGPGGPLNFPTGFPNSTNISANIASGDTFVTVTSASGATVGGLIFIRLGFAATGNPGGWVSKIRGIVGSVIEMESPAPRGSDATVGVDTMKATFFKGSTGGNFTDCTIDGANCTNKWGMPLFVQGNIGGHFDRLKFTNWYGAGALSTDGSGGPYWEGCYAFFGNGLDHRNCGSAAIASITTVGCTQAKFKGINSFDNGFGPEFAWGSFSNFDDVSSVVSRGRGIKYQGCLDCGGHNVHVSQATSNGFGLTLGTSFCTFSGVHAIGNDGALGGNNIWVEGDSNFNRITNFVATKHAAGQFDIADDSTGNCYTNGVVTTITSADVLFSGSKHQLVNVNGISASSFMFLTLANGDNNNIALPAGTKNFRITGPTGAFALTGLVAGLDGQEVRLWNTTSQVFTVKDQNGSSSAANQIFTNTGADVVTGTRSFVDLIYEKATGLWIVTSHQN